MLRCKQTSAEDPENLLRRTWPFLSAYATTSLGFTSRPLLRELHHQNHSAPIVRQRQGLPIRGNHRRTDLGGL